MRKLIMISMFAVFGLGFVADSFAAVNWVNGYSTHSGQYRSGHYRDTSNDGNPYNNANYLGYNR